MDSKNVNETCGKVFAIHADNSVATHAAGTVPDGAVGFSSESELAVLAVSWPARLLVDIWNWLPSVPAVSKFTDRKTAVRRIWQAVSQPKSEPAGQSVVAPESPRFA